MQEQEKEINLVFEPEENWILLRQGRRGRKSLTHKFVSSFDGFTLNTKIQGCESRIYNNIEFCQKSRTTMSNFRADKLELWGFRPVFSTVFFLWLFQLIRRPRHVAPYTGSGICFRLNRWQQLNSSNRLNGSS